MYFFLSSTSPFAPSADPPEAAEVSFHEGLLGIFVLSVLCLVGCIMYRTSTVSGSHFVTFLLAPFLLLQPSFLFTTSLGAFISSAYLMCGACFGQRRSLGCVRKISVHKAYRKVRSDILISFRAQ